MATVFSWNNPGLFLVLSVWHILLPRTCNWLLSSQGHHKPQGALSPKCAGRILLVAAGPARCSSLPCQLWDSKAATSGNAGLGTWGFQVLCSRLRRTTGNMDTVQRSLAKFSFRDKILKYGEKYHQEMPTLKMGERGNMS